MIGLHGIAAPGKSQTCRDEKGRDYDCGQVSARPLAARIAAATITCQIRDADTHGHAMTICRKDKEVLSAWMVCRGHAVADRRAQPSYFAEEKRAWGKRRSLWVRAFEDSTLRKRDIPPPTNAVTNVQLKAAPSELVHLNERLPVRPQP